MVFSGERREKRGGVFSEQKENIKSQIAAVEGVREGIKIALERRVHIPRHERNIDLRSFGIQRHVPNVWDSTSCFGDFPETFPLIIVSDTTFFGDDSPIEELSIVGSSEMEQQGFLAYHSLLVPLPNGESYELEVTSNTNGGEWAVRPPHCQQVFVSGEASFNRCGDREGITHFGILMTKHRGVFSISPFEVELFPDVEEAFDGRGKLKRTFDLNREYKRIAEKELQVFDARQCQGKEIDEWVKCMQENPGRFFNNFWLKAQGFRCAIDGSKRGSLGIDGLRVGVELGEVTGRKGHTRRNIYVIVRPVVLPDEWQDNPELSYLEVADPDHDFYTGRVVFYFGISGVSGEGESMVYETWVERERAGFLEADPDVDVSQFGDDDWIARFVGQLVRSTDKR